MADNKGEKVTDLEKALDESLAELAKAAGAEESKGDKKDEDEDAKGDEKKEDKDAKGEDKKDEDEDAKGDEKKEDEDAKGEKPDFLKKKGDKDKKDEDEKKDDEDEKSMRDGRKAATHESLTKSETVANAIEVSKFLRELTKAQADVIGELSHRVRSLEKSINAIGSALVKSQSAQNDIIKSFGADVEKMGKTPLPRKGVIGTIEKSMRGDKEVDADGEKLSKAQIAERLCALEIEGKVPFNTTTKFESTGELNKSFEKLVHESK